MAECASSRRTGVVAVAVLALLLVVPATGALAEEVTTSGPVRFEAEAGTVIELGDGRRFSDTLEFRLAPDGTPVLVNELSMDGYLAGVAEMPPRWHGEALKAQAVAARTYAWRSIERGTFDARGVGYDICATVACQVFRGTAVVEESAHGERWRAAIRETSGEVLLHDGAPILARYFSTSGGQTVPNEVAFPDSGPRDYLVGIEDPDDAVSPMHRWTVTFTREEFDDILSRGETLAATVPVADVGRRGEVTDPHAEVVVTGADGTEVAVPAVRFREFVSRVAADRHPDRFPGRRADGAGRLPATLPSSRFSFEVDDEEVTVEGRGWGHGVGMGQYGARAKAMRGMAYDDILATYYNGLRPQIHEDVPERVRVGLDVADEVEVHAEAAVRLVAGDGVIAERTLGAWRIQREGGAFRLVPPEGRSADLDVSATAVAAGVPGDDDHVVVETEVNKPVELALEVHDAAGEPVLARDLGVAEAGTHAATWRYRDADGEPVGEGDYLLTLVGTDEQGARDGSPAEVPVTEPVTASGGPDEAAGGPSGPLVALLVVVTAAATVATVVVRRRT